MSEQTYVSVFRPVAFRDRFLTRTYRSHPHLPKTVTKRFVSGSNLRFTLFPMIQPVENPITKELFWEAVAAHSELSEKFSRPIEGTIASLAIRSLSVLLIPDQKTYRQIREETIAIASILDAYQYADRGVPPHISALVRDTKVQFNGDSHQDFKTIDNFADSLQKEIEKKPQDFIALNPVLKIKTVES